MLFNSMIEKYHILLHLMFADVQYLTAQLLIFSKFLFNFFLELSYQTNLKRFEMLVLNKIFLQLFVIYADSVKQTDPNRIKLKLFYQLHLNLLQTRVFIDKKFILDEWFVRYCYLTATRRHQLRILLRGRHKDSECVFASSQFNLLFMMIRLFFQNLAEFHILEVSIFFGDLIQDFPYLGFVLFRILNIVSLER